MAETDFKVTVLGAINEVRRKTKLSPVTTIDADSDSLLKLHLLNDVVSDLSDHGDWQELYTEAIVSVQTSVREYAVSGVVVQSVSEISISTRQAALRPVDLEEIRLLQRVNGTGAPYHWCLKGINGEGNPIIAFDRWPTSNDDGYFKVCYYEKPAVYTTADASATVPFPGRVVVQGLHAKTILDESDGEPSDRFRMTQAIYEDMKQQSYNRFNGDTGGNVNFRPGKRR